MTAVVAVAGRTWPGEGSSVEAEPVREAAV